METLKKELPILFNSEMVRAVLDGRKTQTRRVVKGVDGKNWLKGASCHVFDALHKCPYGQVGDELWVKETWFVGACGDAFSPKQLHAGTWVHHGIWYKADDHCPTDPISQKGRIRQSIFMMRWASRIQLKITQIRVERVQDIGNPDALAEGCLGGSEVEGYSENNPADPYEEFAILWDSINEKRGYSWQKNPWVWVIEFEKINVRTN